MKLISREAARNKGLTRYFTGTACGRGHIVPRRVSNFACTTCTKITGKNWRKENRAYYLARRRKNFLKRRTEAFAKVGNVCECCKEDRVQFLTIDHKKGGGNKHRKEINNGRTEGGSWRYYQWIIKQPDRTIKKLLRILCWNCNLATAIYGVCPHQQGVQ